MPLKWNGEIVTLADSAAERAATAEHLTVEGDASAAIRLAELDQADPAGRYQIIVTGDQLLIQRAATANWATFTTLLTVGSSGEFISTVAATPALVAKNTNDGASVAVASFEGDRATMADDDEAFISLKMSDEAGTQTEMARIIWAANDVTDATEDGFLGISVLQGGTLRRMINMFSTPAGVLNFNFNPNNLDVDYGFATDTNTSAFLIDGGLNGGVGVASFGGAAVADRQLRVGHPAVTATAATNYFTLYATQSGAVTVPAGVTAMVASLAASEPNITATGTVTDSATVYIADVATEGTRNWYLAVGATPPTVFGIDSGGAVYIGDNSNANMTVGITVNQGANDNQAIALKSSDVATVLTSVTAAAVETDDYLTVQKFSATLGGALVQALAEDAATATVLALNAYGGTANTAKDATARALIEVYAAEHDGANALADITADGNVFAIRARRGAADVTVMFVDEDGDLYIDGAGGVGTVGTFDNLPDHEVARAITASLRAVTDPLRAAHEDLVQLYRPTLESAGIISADGMLNTKRLGFFQLDAIWQLGQKIVALEAKLKGA